MAEIGGETLKHKDKKSSIKIGIILTYVRLAIYLLLALFYPPYLLQMVGKVDNGLYQFSVAAISFVLLASFGIENTFVRFSVIAKEKDGDSGQAKINGFYLFLFGIIGIIELLIGVIIAFLFKTNVFVIKEATDGTSDKVFWLLLITALSFSSDFFLSIFSWYTYLKSRFAFMQISLLITHVVTIGLSFAVLFFGGGIIWVAIVSAIAQFLFDIVNAVYCFVALKMKISFPDRQEFSKTFKEVVVFSFFIFLTVVVSQINANLGKTVLESAGDNSMVTVYSYGIQFYSYEALISVAISDSFTPRVNELAIQKKDQEVSSLFLLSSKLQMVVLLFIVGCFAACGLDFISVWLAKSDLTSENLKQIFFLGLGFLLLWAIPLSETVGLEIQKANNKHKFLAVFNLFAALASVVITVISVLFLPYDFKVYGPLIGMVVAVVLGMVVVSNIYYKKALKLPIKEFLMYFGITSLITILAWGVVFGVFGYVITLPNWLGGYFEVIVKAMVFMAIYLPLVFLLLRKEFNHWKASRKAAKEPSSKNSL
jgi:O-antigen/teichoic acid export membrane protein